MRVEIVANRLSEMDPVTTQLYTASQGDVLTVPDEFGRHLCDRGWAKDTAGQYASAPFRPGVASVRPTPLTVKGKGKAPATGKEK